MDRSKLFAAIEIQFMIVAFTLLVSQSYVNARLGFSRFLQFPMSPSSSSFSNYEAAPSSYATADLRQARQLPQPTQTRTFQARVTEPLTDPELSITSITIEREPLQAAEPGEEVAQSSENAAARNQISLKAPQIDSTLDNCLATYGSNVALAAAYCLRPKPTCGHKVIMYFTAEGEFPLLVSQASYITHINFAFPVLHFDGSVTIGTSEALQRLLDVMSLKQTATGQHLKLLISIGGWDNSEHFSSIAADAVKFRRFIQHLLDMVQKYELDGIDLDWEYPATSGLTANTSRPEDRQNFVTMLRTLRTRLTAQSVELRRKENYLLTIAATAGVETLDKGYDIPQIMKYIDWINIMTYDYYGAWPNKEGARTGPLAPLYQSAPAALKQYDPTENIDATITAYIERSQQPEKLILGLPFYGRFWNKVPYDAANPQNMWRTAEIDRGTGKTSGGFESYRNIRSQWMSPANHSEFEHYFDEGSRTPWMYGPRSKILLTYDNEKSIEEKTRYAIDRRLGGVMVWAVDLDDERYSLLRAIHTADLCSSKTSSAQQQTVQGRSSQLLQAASSQNYQIPLLRPRAAFPFARWWTYDNDRTRAGMCGKRAPLISGEFYAHCNPSDKLYACCDKDGYCGSGSRACDCPTCLNYYSNPALIYREPQKPTLRQVQWHTLDSPVFHNSTSSAQCGPNAPLINSRFAICNPDDDFGYCCSAFGFCGIGYEYCHCLGCINYRRQAVAGSETPVVEAANHNVVEPEIESLT